MKASELSFVANDESVRPRIVVDSVPALIHTARPDGYIDFFNQTWLNFIGQPLDNLLGWGWTSWIHPEDLEVLMRKRRESLATGDRFEEEARVLRADGEFRWMIHCAVSQRDAHGNVVEWFGASIDIEDRKRAEEALRRSEAYLAEGQRLVHAGSWAFDAANDKYVYVSEEDLRIWGFDPGTSPTREEVFRRMLPEDRGDAEASFQKTIREKVDTQYEYRIVLPNGTVKHLHTIRHPVLNEAGELVKLVGTSIDITDRKRAEAALHDSETRFRIFVDHAADAFFMLDFEEGTIIDASRCACEGLGYSRQELIGMTPLVFDVNLDRTTFESIAAQAAAGETVLFDRHWHRRKDGSEFPVEVQTSAFWYGGRRFLLKVARDITDRLRAEEVVRQSEKELRDVIQTMPSIALTNRPDGSVEFVNQRWQDYTGMSMEESTGSGWQCMIHPQDRDGYLEKRRAAIASGKPYEGEFRIRCGATGEYRWFLTRVVPLRDERGNILRWYGTVTDIDDRKRAEEKLQHENVALREEIDKSSMFEEIVGSSAALRPRSLGSPKSRQAILQYSSLARLARARN